MLKKVSETLLTGGAKVDMIKTGEAHRFHRLRFLQC